jgi:HEAT repeat protein
VRGIIKIIVLSLFCWSGWILCSPAQSADEILTSEPDQVVVEDEGSRQLRIYSDALLHGVSDGIRLDAAMGLLIRKDETAHKVLVDVLSSVDNSPARMAVCRALIKGRSLGSAAGVMDAFLLPLVAVVKSPDVPLSRLAAEALLAFHFDQVSAGFSELAQTGSDKQSRLNAIYAFQIRPEPEALRSLIKLLDDADPEIVRAAELALQESFGMPVGTGKDIWAKILADLNQKDPTEIHRERLLRQETRLREVQTERDRWQKLYIDALDKEFELLDAAAKTAYLQDKLESELSAIRLWALDKVQRFTSEAAAGLREKLLALLSDDSRQVRLATAKTLSTMSALNPAEKLLDRYQQENDPQVAAAIFGALGEACFFAFSPGSKITLPVEIKTQVLQLADGYTSKDDPEMSKNGAEVLRKMLELDGLTPKETEHYLKTILDRYVLETEKKGTIRGELLTIMARFCGQGNKRTVAIQMYRPTFESVLQTYDDNNLVRQAAATGMVYADKTAAMQLFRQVSLQNDSSPAVRQIYIDLAGQVGTADDLEWLSGLFAANGQGEQVWLAMVSIFQRQDASFIAGWVSRMEQNQTNSDPIREILLMAEQKASVQKDTKLLCDLQVRLLRWYSNKKNYEQVATFREKLSQGNRSDEFVQNALRQTDELAFDAYLQLRKFSSAAGIIGDLLRENRIVGTSAILDKIGLFMASEKTSVEDKRLFLKSLSELTISNDQMWWNEKIEQWRSFEATEEEIVPKADINTKI